MEALNDYVIIEPKTRTDDLNASLANTGLEVNTTEGEPHKGVIRAVGPDVKIAVQVKDVVVFDEAAPRGFKIDDKGYLFVRSKFVIAKLGVENDS